MIPSGNVVSVVSCCSSVLLAYIFASESIKFEQPSIGLGFRLRVLLCGSVSVENAGGVDANCCLFSRLTYQTSVSSDRIQLEIACRHMPHAA